MTRIRRRLALPALFTTLALVMIRPTQPGRLPDNTGDPALLIWIMSWAGRGLVTQPTNYYDAPMFWPNASTFAYSDILATPALPYWAVYGATRNWTVSLIVVSLLFTVLAQVGAYLAAMRVTGRRDAAVIAAISFAFGSYALGRWASLQLNSVGILALGLVAFFHLLDRPSARRGLLLGLAVIATFYASAYYGALMLLLLAVLSPAVVITRVVRRDRKAGRLLTSLIVAGAFAGVAIAPTALVSLRLQEDVGLKRELAPEFDLVARDLVRPSRGSYVWDRLDVEAPKADYEHRFFPGAIALGLGAAGVVAVGIRVVRRRPVGPANCPHSARDLALLGVAGAVALALATGSAGLGPFAPWRFVYDHVPGFSGIRAVSRLAVPTLLAGSVFAAVGYAALTSRLRHRGALRAVALVACAGLMLLELSAPRLWAPLDTSEEKLAVYKALASRPEGPVLELPMADPRVDPGLWAYVEAPRLVYSTLDWHPRVNGYSGSLTPGYLEDLDAYAQFPGPVATDRLRAKGVRYVVLHVGSENGHPALSETEATDRLRRLPPDATSTREGSAYLIDLTSQPSRQRGD